MTTEDELRHFWGELFGRWALDEMVARLAEDFVQRDHRPLHSPRGDRDDWRRALEGWRGIAQTPLREVELLGEKPPYRAFRLLWGGGDEISGGAMEVAVFVVDRTEGGLIAEADVFDDRAAALACFADATGRPEA